MQVMQTRSLRRFTTVLAALVLAGGAAACGGGSGDDSGGADGSGGVAKSAEVKKAMQPTERYTVPSEPLDPAKLKGRTIHYIPLNQQVPAFAVTARNMTRAAELVGMKVQVCDGGANPSQISGCVDRAVGAQAGAIIAYSIPYGMAQNSFDKAVGEKIPVVVMDQIRPDGTKDTEEVAYLPGAIQMQQVLARWAIDDSGGSANVVVSMLQDSPSTVAYVEKYAMPTYKNECGDCEVSINKVSAANFQRIAPSTSAALLKNPDAKYLQVEFEDILQPTLEAVRQANRTDIKVAVSGVTTAGLEILKNGGPVKAGLAQHFPYQGWASLDLAMRMMLGMEPEEYVTPVRLITSENIGGIELTAEAQASGAWFGTPSYEEEFKKLWDVR